MTEHEIWGTAADYARKYGATKLVQIFDRKAADALEIYKKKASIKLTKSEAGRLGGKACENRVLTSDKAREMAERRWNVPSDRSAEEE